MVRRNRYTQIEDIPAQSPAAHRDGRDDRDGRDRGGYDSDRAVGEKGGAWDDTIEPYRPLGGSGSGSGSRYGHIRTADDAYESERRIGRMYRDNGAPRDSGNEPRMREINDAPLSHHQLGFLGGGGAHAEAYHRGMTSGMHSAHSAHSAHAHSADGPCVHAFACTKCMKPITLWSLLYPEIPKMLLVALAAFALYTILVRDRDRGRAYSGALAPKAPVFSLPATPGGGSGDGGLTYF